MWLIKVWIFVAGTGVAVTLDPAVAEPTYTIKTDATTEAECNKQRRDVYGHFIDTPQERGVTKCEQEAGS